MISFKHYTFIMRVHTGVSIAACPSGTTNNVTIDDFIHIVCTLVLFRKHSFTSHTHTHETHGLTQRLSKFRKLPMIDDLYEIIYYQ